jgi:hypothetical protein
LKSSFVAYIDESGDEGFVFNADGSGSSRWFVLSAAVIRQANDLQTVSCLKEARAVLQRLPKTPLHFVDLRHEQRIPYIRRVGELPVRVVSVLIFKPLIAEPEKFQNSKLRLYRYATRMLLERVSWLCRDHHNEGVGDGSCEVIFSNRSIQAALRHQGEPLRRNGAGIPPAPEIQDLPPQGRGARVRREAVARGFRDDQRKSPRGFAPRGLMRSTGPRNRGSHPCGLPLTRSGLYLSCAYPARRIAQMRWPVKPWACVFT